MLIILICIALAALIFGIGFGITGAFLAALIWMIKLPVAVTLWIFGAALCCTLILIPVGILLFKAGTAVLI